MLMSHYFWSRHTVRKREDWMMECARLQSWCEAFALLATLNLSSQYTAADGRRANECLTEPILIAFIRLFLICIYIAADFYWYPNSDDSHLRNQPILWKCFHPQSIIVASFFALKIAPIWFKLPKMTEITSRLVYNIVLILFFLCVFAPSEFSALVRVDALALFLYSNHIWHVRCFLELFYCTESNKWAVLKWDIKEGNIKLSQI